MAEPVRHRIDDPAHADWLDREATRLFGFYPASADPVGGGFWWLDDNGRPSRHKPKELWVNARMVHCYALGSLTGYPGSADLVRTGLAFLREGIHDPEHGGWYWSVGPDGNVVTDKRAYGHAFVLLAAASAMVAGFDGADLLADVTGVIDRYFWRPDDGLCVDSYDRTFSACEPYRGQNGNMHMAEAFLAAAEATGDPDWLARAVRVATEVIARRTASNDWRLPEHFHSDWTVDIDYHRDRPRDDLRPYGSMIGHWFEWSRLLLQMATATPVGTEWMPAAAVRLFDRGIAEGWDVDRTGLRFAVDWDGTPINDNRHHWVVTEAIGAAVYLFRATGDARFDEWYGRLWDYAERFLIDRAHGSWWHQLDRDNRFVSDGWEGKPDLYHSLQATLFARISGTRGLAAALAAGELDR